MNWLLTNLVLPLNVCGGFEQHTTDTLFAVAVVMKNVNSWLN